MKYLIHYDPVTGEIKERRPQDLTYPTPMPEPYIIATEAQFTSTLAGNKRINPETRGIEDAPPTVISLDEAKKIKKQEIADARYQTEIAGITVGGHFVATDDRSKSLIFAAAGRARADAAYTVGWKKANGEWVDLTAPEIIAVDEALTQWVEDCFSRERYFCGVIDNKETVEQVVGVKWSM